MKLGDKNIRKCGHSCGRACAGFACRAYACSLDKACQLFLRSHESARERPTAKAQGTRAGPGVGLHNKEATHKDAGHYTGRPVLILTLQSHSLLTLCVLSHSLHGVPLIACPSVPKL